MKEGQSRESRKEHGRKEEVCTGGRMESVDGKGHGMKALVGGEGRQGPG